MSTGFHSNGSTCGSCEHAFMSLFIDYKLTFTEETVGSLHVHPLLDYIAVLLQSNQKGEVAIFDLQGKRQRHSQVIISEPHTALIKWNPVHAVLSVGLHDGSVQLFNFETDAIYVADEKLKSAVCILCWSKQGTLLLSSDNLGNVFVYKAGNDAQLTSVFLKVFLEDVVQTVSIPLVTPHSQFSSGFDSSRGNLQIGDSCTESKVNDTLCLYYLGCRSGKLYALFSDGNVKLCCTLQGGVSTILLFHERHIIVCLSQDFFLYQYKITATSAFENIMEVKLSFRNQWPQIIWTGSGVLGFCSGESVVRIWDLTTEANFILSLSECQAISPDDRVTNIAFCQRRGILAAGTLKNFILLWQRDAESPENRCRWFIRNLLTIPGPIAMFEWSETAVSLAIASETFVEIYTEVPMVFCSSPEFLVVQINRTSISICKLYENFTKDFNTGGSVNQLCISDSRLLIAADDLLSVYNITEDCSLEKLSAFAYSGKEVVLLGMKVCILERNDCLNIIGITDGDEKIAPILQQSSRVLFMRATAGRLCVAFEYGPLLVYEVKNNSEFRQLYRSPTVPLSEKQSIASVSCNVLCDCICFTLKMHDGIPNECIYIWNAMINKIYTSNLKNDLARERNCGRSSPKEDESRSRQPFKRKVYLIAHCWDTMDRRMLFCQVASKPEMNRTASFAHGKSLIMVYFVTLDHDVLVQHIADISPSCDTLLAARTPYFYFNAKIDLSTEPENKEKKKDDCELRINKFLIRATWPVFAGLESCDSECKSAAIDFIIHSTAGDMNEALKVIRSIKRDESSSVSNSSLWESIGKICIRYGKTTAVQFCFRKMRSAYLGNSMRFALEDSSDPNVQLGLLAEQLNLQDFAIRTFYDSCRYDWLNNLYQNSSQWEKAVEIAESHDRIHLKNTCYHYAQFLEKSGETNKAIEWYEKASVAHAEIPRLLLPFLSRLEEYVREKKDLRLFQWLAKYKESNDDMDGAVSYYLEAKNFSSLLRILCHQGKIEEAVRVAKESGNRAACYQLAKYYEARGNYNDAVHFFSLSEAYKSAIRICKECHFDDRIVDLALKATNSVMIDAAKYYGKRQGMVDKAVMLYHKAGLHDEAMSLASQTEQFTAMNLVASELKQQADPMMLDKCAQFFLQNKQYSKAVELLAEAKRCEKAIRISIENNIPLNEKMADLMTPSKEEIEDSKLRNELIEELGDSCMKQGLYSCAAKKYIQAGVRRKAMKALIINGDWQKIVLFTNAAKSRELYIIAANYLCTLDWHATPEISNSIVQFYKKASAYEQLANFYCLWAKVDVEESCNYETSLVHLNQSLKCLQQCGASFGTSELKHRVSETEQKIALMRRFISVKNATAAAPNEMIKELLSLLDDDGLTETLQVGDVYGAIINQYVLLKDFVEARRYLELLQRSAPEDQQERYVSSEVKSRIIQSTAKTPSQDSQALNYDLANGTMNE